MAFPNWKPQWSMVHGGDDLGQRCPCRLCRPVYVKVIMSAASRVSLTPHKCCLAEPRAKRVQESGEQRVPSTAPPVRERPPGQRRRRRMRVRPKPSLAGTPKHLTSKK